MRHRRLDWLIRYPAKSAIEPKRQPVLDIPPSRDMTASQHSLATLHGNYSGAAPTGGPLRGLPGGGRCRNVIVA
jgi:hypothetical protein